jgi:hypothetical protein
MRLIVLLALTILGVNAQADDTLYTTETAIFRYPFDKDLPRDLCYQAMFGSEKGIMPLDKRPSRQPGIDIYVVEKCVKPMREYAMGQRGQFTRILCDKYGKNAQFKLDCAEYAYGQLIESYNVWKKPTNKADWAKSPAPNSWVLDEKRDICRKQYANVEKRASCLLGFLDSYHPVAPVGFVDPRRLPPEGYASFEKYRDANGKSIPVPRPAYQPAVR